MDSKEKARMEALENALREEAAKKDESAPPASEAKTPQPELAADLKKALEESKEKLLRTAAELDNFRKRSEKDVKSAYASGVESAIFPVLKLFDVFELAVNAANKTEDVASVRKGLSMVMADFARIIAELGVARIENAAGKDFDPALHDAVMRDHSDSVPEGKVLSQLNSGYKMGGRVVKAAQVVVSAGPAKLNNPKT